MKIIILLILPILVFSFDASFDCSEAYTSIEKHICSDKELAQSDIQLDTLYKYLQKFSTKKKKEMMQKKQRIWVKNRIKICAVPKEFVKNHNVLRCLNGEYQSRIKELQSLLPVPMEVPEENNIFYSIQDSSDTFAGYYANLYAVHTMSEPSEAAVVESFVHIIKIKDPDMKNKYYVRGNFTCANFHNCTINNAYSNDNSMMEYIIMEPKDGKLLFIQKIDEDRTCRFQIEIKRDALVLHSEDPDCTQYCFSGGVRCWLDGWEFKLKNTDKVVQKNFENILYPLYKNGKYGYINSKGNWVIKAQFDEAYGFEEDGSAIVGIDGNRNTINRKGELTSQWSENDAKDDNSSRDMEQKNLLEEELYPLKKGDKYGLANEKGEWILEAQFDDVMVINEVGGCVDANGWIKVKINKKWGVITKEGAWVLKPQFDEISYFELTNLIAAKHNGKYGLINKKGEWILQPKFDEIRRYGECDATGFGIIMLNGKWGLIDKRGEWVLKQKFDHIEILNDRIYVKFGGQEGYTTLDGDYLTFTKDELRNERYKDKNSRTYPFVCYQKKIKDNTDRIIYQKCARSEAQCSTIEKLHFGEYLNDFKAYEAFERCSK